MSWAEKLDFFTTYLGLLLCLGSCIKRFVESSYLESGKEISSLKGELFIFV